MTFRITVFYVLNGLSVIAADSFTVATYNVENYFLKPHATRKEKSLASRQKVAEAIALIRPDVLAIQEIGRKGALDDLRNRLSQKNLDYPHHLWLQGPDSAIHLALLSRFPVIGNHSKSNVMYLLDRRRFQVSRGFIEVVVQVNPGYRFTLFNAHLKSMRPIAIADQAEMRLEEARALRRFIDKRLKVDSEENILLVGDLNDSPSKDSVKTLIGRHRSKLIDLRPFETSGVLTPSQASLKSLSRRVTWTHFYAKDDQYSRFDYILASPGIHKEYVASFVQAQADWGMASDHRVVVAKFIARDR